MEVFDFLSGYSSSFTSGSFNGYLMDYVETHQSQINELFSQILEVNKDVKVFAGFELKILHELISNKKIGYRDIAKVPEGYVRVPYILYWQNEGHSGAMLINTDSYIEARGMYYCLTEPGNLLEPYKCQVLAVCYNGKNSADILKSFTLLQDSKNPNAMIQRRLDDWNIADADEMHDKCVAISNKLFDEVLTNVKGLPAKEREPFVYNAVTRAFLLKKALYVRYMSNKTLLNDRHSGNIVEQRRFAKAYIDDVRIVSFYSMWNDASDEEN